MKGSGSTFKRCGCKDPETGKPYNRRCPDLTKRRHGTWCFDIRIDTTEKIGRRLSRSGHETQGAAMEALDDVRDLLKLAGANDRMRKKIGDMIFERSRFGGELPTVDEVRRKLGAGADPNAPEATVGEWLEEWYAGKRALKLSTKRGYRQHLDHYLIPILGEIPRDRLAVEHIAGMFDTIEEWNEEIRKAQDENRAPNLPDDKRTRHKLVEIATQHRIRATLRNAYNVAVKRPGMIDWNPVLAVELPPETRDPARTWSPEMVVTFLESSAHDRLALLYRIILLRGLRRGEGVGIRWTDLDDGLVTIAQTILQIGGQIIIDTPKSRAGRRQVSLDSGTVGLIPAHRTRQRRERLAAGEAWQDHGLMFCRQDGRELSPDWVSLHFRELTVAAGLPVIKLHEARHTAATLGLEAGIDIKIVSDQLGHSTTRITQDLYTHVRRAVHDEAAEKVLRFLTPDSADDGTGTT